MGEGWDEESDGQGWEAANKIWMNIHLVIQQLMMI
jgi:hypothetical protein